MTKSEQDQKNILEMLSYKRPANSKSESDFINRFVKPLGTARDTSGNQCLKVGTTPILWSCHTDSVHRSVGRQRVDYVDGWAYLGTEHETGCLGSDDAAGVWIMTEMIKHGIEGYYVFHCEEESCGKGSARKLMNDRELLSQYKAAVAFDRRGKTSVITHQGFSRCCSDAFANSFLQMLPPNYAPDNTGIFTDTHNYISVIPECSNISVGYYKEHTIHETLDVLFLMNLRDYMVQCFDFNKLVIERNPLEQDIDDWSYYDTVPYEYMRNLTKYDKRQNTTTYDKRGNKLSYSDIRDRYGEDWGQDNDYYDFPADLCRIEKNEKQLLIQLIREYPEGIANLLMALNISYEDVRDYLDD